MFKILVKKQLMEVFRGYFYNFKKNKARSKAGIVGMFLMYAGIMIGVLGVMFTALSITLCGALTSVGMDWLYFAITGLLAILLGAFASVFNTFSGLYLGKDNDLLLSMPIPVRLIIASRLANVYILGLMYSSTVIVPALIVYWIVAKCSLKIILCGLLLLLIISAIVMVLGCILGWCVARISRKLKNRSIVSVLASLAFIALYYLFYFKAQNILNDLLANAAVYGEKIKGSAYAVYLFGKIGTGDFAAAGIYLAAAALLFFAVWTVLKRTFIAMATSAGAVKKKVYHEQKSASRTPFLALLSKEFARFTSNPTYMLNAGLGMLFIPAVGIIMLIKSQSFVDVFNDVFGARPGVAWIIMAGAVCLATSMNDMAAPSVSLEGKNIWIPKSLPVDAKTVLRAKTAMHLICTESVMLIAVIALFFAASSASAAVRIMMIIMPLVYGIFSAVMPSFMGIMMPNISWTNETVPIKQSGAVTISIFGGWAVSGVFVVLYFIIGYKIGVALYMAIWTVLLAAASALLMRRIDSEGSRRFENL